MKKILAIILAVLMCISSVAMIASCSNKNDTETPTTENTTPTQTEAPTDAPTELPTEEPTEEPTDEVPPELTPIEEAMAYIHQLYKDSLTDTGNYDLIKAVKIGDVTFNVTWTISGTDQVTIVDKNDTLKTVVVPKAEAEFTYTLTASITHEGETLTREYVHTVPKFEVSGFADYMAAGKGDSVVVEGVITSISSKSEGDSYNNLYLQDPNGDGGYYIYGIKDGVDPVADLGLKLGMTVSVSGIKDIYNKVHEVKDAVIEIVDATEKAIEYIDITDIAKAAESAEADALTNFQGCWVTIKGVEITGQYLAQYYYKWIIGNVDSYTRLSLSSGLEQSVLNEIAAGHTDHKGYLADVKGIVNVYNGAFYLVPLGADAFVYGAMAEVSDDVKVEREKNNLTVNATYTTTSKLELPVVGGTYSNVTIAWTSSNAEVATVAADGKVTFLKAGEVTFTATLTLGTATASATFAVTVETPKDPTPNSVLTIPQALEVAGTKEHDKYTEGKYYVIGTIKSIASDKYGNMTIVDANGNELYVYGTWSEDGNTRYDSLENKPQVGDTVKLYGILGKYNDTLQMKNGWIIPTTPVAPSQETIKITLGGKYVTATPYVYTSSSGSTKDQLVMSENAADAAVFTVIENADGSISFVVDSKFLYADGTNVRLVAEEGEFTKFVYEETDGGVFIKCFTANFNGKAQYLEVYKGYLTCYGMGSDTSIYTFVIETVGSVTPSEETIKITLGGKYVTATPYVYTSSSGSTKDQLVMSENAADAAVFTVIENADGSISFVCNGLYLYADGTNVRLVAEEGEFTKFVYEETDGGVFIKCFTANFNGKAQYLEVYKGYLTCYGMGSDTSIYTFVIEKVGGGSTPPTPPTPPTTSATLEPVKPVVGTEYRLGFVQTKQNKIYYLTGVEGGYNNYYTDVTEDWAKAAVFGIEETTGGYYLFCMVNGAKKYLNMVVSGTHVNPKFQDEASTVYTYSETLKTFVSIANDKEYAFSTYGDYFNPGPSTTDKTDNYFVYFVTAAGTVGGGSTTPENPPVTPEEPEGEKVDVKYTFSEMEKGQQYAEENRVLDDNTTLITFDCYITTELRIYKAEAGGNAYSQWPARNGVAIIKSVKPLKNIVLSLGGKKTTFTISASVDGVTYVEVATIEVTSTDFNEFVVDLGDAGYKYVKLETASQGQVKYFGLNFAEVTAEDFYVAEKPVEGTKYNFVLFQGAAEKFVLVNGLMDGHYMGTTADASAALNFYVEATEGGYYLYTMMNGYKIYLNMVVSGTYVNAKYEPTPSTVYTYDEALKTLVATVNGKTYAFGTRSDKTYTTIGPVVADQYDPFLAQFALSTNDDVAANEPKPGAPITTDDALDILANLPTYGATTTNKYGVKGTVVSVDGTTITIVDANGNTLVIKNVLNATGSAAVENMPVKGDTIVVLGALTNVGGNAMVDGWLQSATTHTCDMTVATCKTPSTCTICGKVEGTVSAEHTDWVEATCAEAAHCTVCGKVEGEKLADCQGWVAPTCSEYGYCTVCGKVGTELAADNHTNVIPATCRDAAYCVDCETYIGEKDPTAHGEKTAPTCERPETCKLCGQTFGEVSGEHGEIVDCECTVCGATIHTGELSVATCMAVSVCGDCGQPAGEKNPANHVGFSDATCTTPATCECGVTQGDVDPDAHGELDDNCVCPLCEETVHNYGDSCVCANGCGIANHVFETGAKTCKYCTEDNPHDVTVKEAIAIANGLASGASTSVKYTVTGVIVEIYGNVQYGNIRIKDAEGNVFTIYGTYVDGTQWGSYTGEKPGAGDTATFYGKIMNFSGNTPEIQNADLMGWTKHTCSMTEATCKAPSTCTLCGRTEGTTADHNYVDGVCTGCGLIEGATIETVKGAYTAGTTTNMSDGNNAASIGLDANVFTVTPAKGGHNLFPGLNKDGSIRLYNSGTNGNMITFAVSGANSIKSVKITFVSGKSATLKVTVNGNEVAQSTANGTTLEVDINAASFMIQNIGSAQVQIKSIEITYYVVDNGGEEGGDDIGGGETGEDETTTEEETTTPPVSGALATFDFGANGAASHADGSKLSSTQSYTNNGFTLNLTSNTNVYGSARDTMGNSCLKLGISSATGSFSFTVGANVNKVVIYVAKYKANSTSVTINGKTYTISGASISGDYDAIEIDTSSTKTINFVTATGKRCMINTIEFWG